jgi:DnaK suppressor protein
VEQGAFAPTCPFAGLFHGLHLSPKLAGAVHIDPTESAAARGRQRGSREIREVLMTEEQVGKYKTLLLARRDELAGKSRRREDIWIVKSNEQIEMVQLAGEREFAVRSLEHQSKSLTQINIALERIEDGEFGICLECEEEISPKRLTAVPWAAYCLHCQEMHDAREAADFAEPPLAA